VTATVNKLYQAIEIPMEYAGKKKEELGFMINRLAGQVDYKTFIDIFGGSGQALMNVDVKGEEYINDFSPLNYNYYVVISDHLDSFKALANRVKDDLRSCNLNAVEYVSGLQILLNNPKRSKHHNTPDPAVKYAKAVFCYYESMCKNFKAVNHADVVAAFAFYFIHSFMYSGKDTSISAVNKENIEEFIDNNLGDWNNVSTRLQNVKKLNEDAISLLTDSRINKEDTLCYLDSPYIGTKQYLVGKFGMPEMKSLLQNLRDFKGEFVFSCRAASTTDHVPFEENPDLRFQESHGELSGRLLEKREAIFQVLHYLLNIHLSRPLYVLFKLNFQGDDDNDNIFNKNITQNLEFEIMVTSFDFDVPDCNDYSKPHERNGDFRKLPFDVFYERAKFYLTELDYYVDEWESTLDTL
jgi:hypothetical protein